LTFKNELNILRQFSLIAILAVGEGLIIITAGIDLSVGALVGMTACAGAWAAAEGAPPSLTLLVILGSGALAGLINGLLVRACPVILARFRLICGGMTPSG
jgi:ribose/xylose/arabinose/galactoside ABC-type transport system permease subunit